MIDVVLQNGLVLYRINKHESGKSLPLLVFRRDVDNAIFLKCLEEGRSSPNHVRIRHFSSDVCYDTRCYLKNKAGVRCAKRAPDAAT